MPPILKLFLTNCFTGRAISSITNAPPAEPLPLIQGGLLNIYNHGVLITGPSGIGKSELALTLIDRGHKLVSDDVTLVLKEGANLVGRAPDELMGLIQLHGGGLFNVKELLGPEVVMASSPLQLIINIDPDIRYEANPLEIARSTVTIIDIELPELTIPRPTQRNMAPIIELLIRKEIAEK